MRASFLRRLDDRALPALTGVIERVIRHRAFLAWLGAGIVLALVGTALASTQRSQDDGKPVARSVTKVGPVEGTVIAEYTSAAQRELAGLTEAGTKPVYALVSLAGYGTPAQAAKISDGYRVSKAYFRVPLVGVQTEIQSADVAGLRRDLEANMRSAAARAERDAEGSDVQAARLSGSSAQERQLRAFYVESARLLREQAKQYRSLCACVYAFVVKATPKDLTTLSRRAGIRVVDPAPEISALDRAVFLPLLPEQAVTVQPPTNFGLPQLPTPSAGPS